MINDSPKNEQNILNRTNMGTMTGTSGANNANGVGIKQRARNPIIKPGISTIKAKALPMFAKY